MDKGIRTAITGALVLLLANPSAASAHWPDGRLGAWGEIRHAFKHVVGGLDGVTLVAGTAILLIATSLVLSVWSESRQESSDTAIP